MAVGMRLEIGSIPDNLKNIKFFWSTETMKYIHHPIKHPLFCFPKAGQTIIFVVMFLLILSLVVVLPRKATAAPTKKTGTPPLVTVVTVAEKDVTPLTEYVGHVEAVQTVTLLSLIHI